MTPPIRPSVFFEGRVASSLTRRQSAAMEEKILACFTWPHIMTSVMPSLLADVDQLAELAEGDPVAAGGERLHFFARLLPGWR